MSRDNLKNRERLLQALSHATQRTKEKMLGCNDPERFEELAEKFYRLSEATSQEEYGLMLARREPQPL